MAKKLMMNNYSENVLMPVMDGLICWLDGRDYITGENVWVDRSKYKNNFITEDIVKNGEGVCCSITGAYAKSYIETPMSYTIETVCSFKTLKTKFTLWATGDNSIDWHGMEYLWANQSNEYLSFTRWRGTSKYDTKQSIYVLNTNQIYNLSITFDYYSQTAILYVNGIKVINTIFKTYTDYINTNCILLMNSGKRDRAVTNGMVYSFKIYNRALTEEEIQQNYLYEQSINRGE